MLRALYDIPSGKPVDTITTKKVNGLIATVQESNTNVFVHLINLTDSSIHYTSQDGNIPMIREAMDENGKWKPIEYWTWSWCGNSYYFLELKSRHEIITSTFHYGGKFKTKIRFKINIGKSIIYTNEFEGRINPKQFKVTVNNEYNSFLDNPIKNE